MESGVNPADQNFRCRRQQDSEYHLPPPQVFDSTSPPRPPKVATGAVSSLTSENLAAITSHGFARDRLCPTGATDPAAFYRGAQEANGYTNNHRYNMGASEAESKSQPSSLRSNGNGTTPKHPQLPQARAGLKPTLRSASTPLDRPALSNAKSTSALNGYSAAQQQTSTSKPPPRIVSRNATPPGFVKDRINTARSASNLNTPASQPGATTNSAIGKQISLPQPRTQRARFMAEDQQSNNTLSSATRAVRLLNSIPGNDSQFSKSMTNLSPTSIEHLAPARKPLFGEVLPVEQGPNVGYGIPDWNSPRRTSDSSLHPPSNHFRRHSDLKDISPTSPTAWYLGVAHDLYEVDPHKRARLSGHNRSHSDFADTKANTMNGVSPSFQTSNSPTTSAAPAPSRLPISRHRLSNSSETSPVTSSHSDYPFGGKVSNGKLRKPETQQRPWSPAGRAITPTSRAKTPTHQSARSRARTPEKPTSNNASLRAYVSVPLPKTSPPLRSSHSRAPISTATTANSRPKTGDRSSPPQQVRTGMKLTRNNAEAKDIRERERKASDVPLNSIDFGAAKDQVRRAYTNSINKSEQEAIRAENYRRLQVKKAAIAKKERQDKLEREQREEDPGKQDIAGSPGPSVEKLVTKAPPPQPLHLDTSFQKLPHVVVRGYDPATGDDSPTLGMPGSFVNDDEPPSAISNATGITEFENESQTEAARLSRMPSHRSALSCHVVYAEDLMSPDQAMYGMQNMDQGSISIMLDAAPTEEPQAEPTPTNDDFSKDPSPPGAFQPDEHYFEQEQPVFASTLVDASPAEAQTTGFSHEKQVESQDEPHLAPAALLSEEAEPLEAVFKDAPRLELPFLRTALSPPSIESGEDFNHTPVTDMEYESSEVGGNMRDEPDLYGSAYDSAREGLTSARQYTFSAHSSWRTDDSVKTDDEDTRRNGFDDQNATPGSESKPTPPPKERLMSPAVPPKPEGYSPLPSPRLQNDIHRIPSPQLPPVATGEGFSFEFPADSPSFGTASIPQWPEYAPPPPPGTERDLGFVHQDLQSPPPSFYNKRPPSSVYQNGLGSESRRASDDPYSPRPSLSTPRSSTQISLEESDLASKQKLTADVPESEEEKRERKRLFQRKMCIKELIDTESVYLKDMNVVEEIYKGTAEACPKLEAPDIKQIFRNSDDVVKFSTKFLEDLKVAAGTLYQPRGRLAKGKALELSRTASVAGSVLDNEASDLVKDLKTTIGACFGKNLVEMEKIYTIFLKNSEIASTRLAELQKDPLVKVWLGECNFVAKDLTAAWDLDALLVKPVQRLTRYPLMLSTLLKDTPTDHPDFQRLRTTSAELGKLIGDIDDLKKRINMVGNLVKRKRKESDTRSGIQKLLGTRAAKMVINPDRMKDDKDYLKVYEKFNDDYLRLQVVLRDVEYYTRTVEKWVSDYLQFTSAMELTIRCAGNQQWPEIESKWIQYNTSIRDLGAHVLEEHVSEVRQKIIEPIEKVISTYSPPALAMKRRDKRRLDFEKFQALTAQKKSISKDLKENVDEYHALNETLKHELPILSNGTKTIGLVCLSQLVCLQQKWWGIWVPKVKICLEQSQLPKSIAELTEMFYRDFKYSEAQVAQLGIFSGEKNFDGSSYRPSESTVRTESSRSRALSMTSDKSPVNQAPEPQKRLSANLGHSPLFSPSQPNLPYPSYPASSHYRVNSNSQATPDAASGSRHYPGRPNTGRSFTSDGGMRPSNDHNTASRRESGSTYNSASHYVDGPLLSMRPQSGLFHSAMPMGEGYEEGQRSSRASSRDRNTSGGYSVLYLAASLFEFNISGTKQEAGYPYLTYQAGEIFDVIGEKGELWLAKNQDDPQDTVGWIWSKHFARLAAS